MIYFFDYWSWACTETGRGSWPLRRTSWLPPPSASDAGFLLAKLHAAGSVVNNRALEEYDLKERSYSVLALAAAAWSRRQREMADFLSLDPSQIVALVDELEKRGLVLRAPGKQDRRAKIVAATAEGQRLFTEATKSTRRAESEALDRLSREEVAELKRLLRKALWPALDG